MIYHRIFFKYNKRNILKIQFTWYWIYIYIYIYFFLVQDTEYFHIGHLIFPPNQRQGIGICQRYSRLMARAHTCMVYSVTVECTRAWHTWDQRFFSWCWQEKRFITLTTSTCEFLNRRRLPESEFDGDGRLETPFSLESEIYIYIVEKLIIPQNNLF